MEYISIQQLADRWNMSKRRIQIMCKEGRIDGARFVGNMWLIPEDIGRPADGRKKSPIDTANKTNADGRAVLKQMLRGVFSVSDSWRVSRKQAVNDTIACMAAKILKQICSKNGKSPDDDLRYFQAVAKLLHLQACDTGYLNDLKMCMDSYFKEGSIPVKNTISSIYQYANLFREDAVYAKTQFFTEPYMIRFLVQGIPEIKSAGRIVDPCCGGGNFLTECLDFLAYEEKARTVSDMQSILNRLIGYDIDRDIANAAVINMKLCAMEILSPAADVDLQTWEELMPVIYVSADTNPEGSLGHPQKPLTGLCDGKSKTLQNALGQADVVLTNPPFATTKGMDAQLKFFLKNQYPLANCDTCVAFLQAAHELLSEGGVCGFVTQTAWMFLDSFQDFRKYYAGSCSTREVLYLGSGAFQDLSGEKANVALLITEKSQRHGTFAYTDLSSCGYQEKIEKVRGETKARFLRHEEIFNEDGRRLNFSFDRELRRILENSMPYSSAGVPMQGTSTGNAKELIDYYWNHFDDPDWVPVSKGGGYSRWEGLNHFVVKWGRDAEYIKNTKGSALRNVKYFDTTEMVFSDTGTAGLNVRILLPGQIFVASGPGIRRSKGELSTHLAYLNSRIASYYIRMLSPKLTVAAGYIAKLPVKDELLSSVVLENNAITCIERKRRFLRRRPTNLEFDAAYLDEAKGNPEELARNFFVSELKEELFKLELEGQIDREILRIFDVSPSGRQQICEAVGECVYFIEERRKLNLTNLDRMISKNLDCRCQIKRSRADKHTMGCDGLLEFLARSLELNPAYLVQEICDHAECFPQTIAKYKKLTLHNLLLREMKYNTQNGIQTDCLQVSEVLERLHREYAISSADRKWFRDEFHVFHRELFFGSSLLMENGGEFRIAER